MPFKGNDFQFSRGETYAYLNSDYYGQEHDDKLGELVDLENGIRKYWADQLRKLAEDADPEIRKYLTVYFDLLDPYNDRIGDSGEFARTTLTDAPEGEKWITPTDDKD